jgi:crossover junction endodeoxyribonuclease RuvC
MKGSSRGGGLLKAAERQATQRAGKKHAERRIIGVDPGLASTGWGVVDCANGRLSYVAHGCIETRAGMPRGERLVFIHQSFLKILKKFLPSEAAMENLYFGKNITSAMSVAEARGVLLLALSARDLPVTELTPNAIKQAVVGVSRADKNQIQEMVRLLLGLPEIPKPDHAADALGAAICAGHTR